MVTTFLLHHAKLGAQNQKLGVQLHSLLQHRTATDVDRLGSTLGNS